MRDSKWPPSDEPPALNELMTVLSRLPIRLELLSSKVLSDNRNMAIAVFWATLPTITTVTLRSCHWYDFYDALVDLSRTQVTSSSEGARRRAGGYPSRWPCQGLRRLELDARQVCGGMKERGTLGWMLCEAIRCRLEASRREAEDAVVGCLRPATLEELEVTMENGAKEDEKTFRRLQKTVGMYVKLTRRERSRDGVEVA